MKRTDDQFPAHPRPGRAPYSSPIPERLITEEAVVQHAGALAPFLPPGPVGPQGPKGDTGGPGPIGPAGQSGQVPPNGSFEELDDLGVPKAWVFNSFFERFAIDETTAGGGRRSLKFTNGVPGEAWAAGDYFPLPRGTDGGTLVTFMAKAGTGSPEAHFTVRLEGYTASAVLAATEVQHFTLGAVGSAWKTLSFLVRFAPEVSQGQFFVMNNGLPVTFWVDDFRARPSRPAVPAPVPVFGDREERGYVAQDYFSDTAITWRERLGGVPPTWASMAPLSGWFPDAYGKRRWFPGGGTAATVGNVGALANQNTTQAITNGYLRPRLSTHVRTSSDLTSQRVWVALTNFTIGGGDTATLGTQAAMGFRYSTSAGDTKWQVYTWDRTSANLVDTGVVVSPDTPYHFEIAWEAPGIAGFFINGVLVARLTARVPADSEAFRVYITITTLVAAQRGIGVGVPILVSNLANPQAA